MYFHPTEAIWPGALGVIVSLLASVVGSAHSIVEQSKSRRPSLLLSLHCATSLPFEAILLRSLVLSGLATLLRPFSCAFTVAYASKACILVMENLGFSGGSSTLKIDEKGGLLSRALMLYMLPILKAGYKGQLTQEAIDRGHTLPKSERLYGVFEAHFDLAMERGRSRPLFCALWRTLSLQLLSPIVPCVSMALFQIALPFIAKDLLRFVDDSPLFGQLSSSSTGFGLIGAQALTTLGLALTLTWFLRASMRAAAAIRCVLLQAVFHQTLRGGGGEGDNLHEDVHLICEFLHAWYLQLQSLLLIILFPALFWTDIAAWSLLTAGVALLSLIVGPYLVLRSTSASATYTRTWSQRLALSASALRCVQSLRCLALEEAIMQRIGHERAAEIAALLQYGKRQVVAFTGHAASDVAVYISAVLPYIISRGHADIDGPLLWSMLIYIELIALPLFSLAGLTVRHLMPALQAFVKIEKFLLARSARGELRCISAQDEERMQVQPHFSDGMLTVVTGDESGRSAILSALLGDDSCLDGEEHSFERVAAYVSAEPAFVEDASMRENIEYLRQSDHKRYMEALLFAEFSDAPDVTPARLSAGQKIQLAVARAIFSRSSTIVIDQAFDSLDAETAELLWNNLLGRAGLWRGKTVILFTSGHKWLRRGDNIAVCDSLGIGAQGSVAEMAAYLLNTASFAEGPTPRILPAIKEASKATNSGFSSETASVMEKRYIAHDLSKYAERPQRTLQVTWRYLASLPTRHRLLSLCIVAFVAIAIWLSPPLLAALYVDLKSPSNIEAFIAGWLVLYAAYVASALLLAVLVASRLPRVASGLYHAELLRRGIQTAQKITMELLSVDICFADKTMGLVLAFVCANALGVIANVILACLPAQWLIAVFALAMFLLLILDRIAERSFRVLRRLERDIASKLRDQLSRIQVTEMLRYIRASHLEPDVCWQHTQMVERSQQAFFLGRSANIFVTMWACLVLGLVSCLLFVFAVVWRRQVWTTTLGGAIFTMNRLLTDIVFLYHFLVELRVSCLHLGRLQQAVHSDYDAERAEQPWSTKKGSIRLDEVTVRDETSTRLLLADITLHIRPGERIGIFGPAGSGKSTLLRALAGLVRVESGKISIDRCDIARIAGKQLRRSITFIAQETALLELDLRDNLDLDRLHADSEIWAALEIVGARHFVESLPGKLDTAANDIQLISQRQLLLLARAILRKRRIWMLDDTLWALDEATERAVWQALDQELHGVTTLLVSSRLDTLQQCDRVINIRDGKVQEAGRPSQLLQDERSAFYKLARLSKCTD